MILEKNGQCRKLYIPEGHEGSSQYLPWPPADRPTCYRTIAYDFRSYRVADLTGSPNVNFVVVIVKMERFKTVVKLFLLWKIERSKQHFEKQYFYLHKYMRKVNNGDARKGVKYVQSWQ